MALTDMNCSGCSKQLQAEWGTCPFCGTGISREQICQNCKSNLQPGWIMCPTCGTSAGETPSAGGQSVQDSTVRSLQQIGTVNVGVDSQKGRSERDYCVVCHLSLPDEHFRCPECAELACTTCRSPRGICLNCRTVPGQVKRVEATSDGATATLKWEKPERDGGVSIENYVIRCVELQSLEWNTKKSRYAVINNLPAGQSYTFTVEAHNAIGAGEQSIPTLACLISPASPGQPINAHAEIDNSEILLRWDPPESDGGSPINKYSIVGYGPESVSIDAGKALNVRIGDIERGVYKFAVVATNSTGNSTESVQTGPIEYGAVPPLDCLTDLMVGFITTAAGSGTSGFSGDGGPAREAELNEPRDIAVDRYGTIYIADTKNHRIREINPATGVIQTVVGSGSKGYSGDGGSALNANLNSPKGVCLDVDGNLYIADTGNHRVRKIERRTGMVSTVAGNGKKGFGGDGGFANVATIRDPNRIAIDSDGNLFIAPAKGRDIIRRVDSKNGLIESVAGGEYGYNGDGGAAKLATLKYPEGVAVDIYGNVFIADKNNKRVRRIDGETGVISTFAGIGKHGYEGDGGPATAAKISYPEDVAVDGEGTVFILDGGMDMNGNRRVRKVDLDGVISTVAGDGNKRYFGDEGPAAAASIYAKGIAVDVKGNLWIADTGNHRVRVVRGPL